MSIGLFFFSDENLGVFGVELDGDFLFIFCIDFKTVRFRVM